MKTVRARLLGVMSAIVIPVAVGIGTVAYSGYSVEVREIDTIQAAAASGRAGVIQSWLETVGRAFANQAIAAAFLDADQCGALARALIGHNSDFAAVRFVDSTGQACSAGESLDPSQLPRDLTQADGLGFRAGAVGNRIWVATTGTGQPAVLVLEPSSLLVRLKPLGALGEENVALIAAGTRIVSQSSDDGLSRWIPKTLPNADGRTLWVGMDRRGREVAFALAPVLGPDLAVLMQFDEQRRVDAWRRAVALCLAPFALLALLTFTYATSIQRNVVRWIKVIEAAARARGRNPDTPTHAPVDPRMPSELRRVAQTFNAMAERVDERRRALETSLAENQALMQEMHHRIKNSLQVIQSYLTLVRRMGPPADNAALLRISGRISVFAIAYRIALTPGGIRPVTVGPFLDEVAAALFMNLRHPNQRTSADFQWDGELDIDRAIPAGLAMVEAIIACADLDRASVIAVRLHATEDGAVELVVAADDAPSGNRPPEKIMIGLASQLGATRMPTSPSNKVLDWRFRP